MIGLRRAVARAKQGQLTMDYAGFWMRVVAFLIDSVILIIALIPMALLFGTSSFNTVTGTTSYGLPDLVSPLIALAYCVGFEGSAKQATPGKMAMGLIVIQEHGRRVSYPRVFARFVIKSIMFLIFVPGVIGLALVAFTTRKQGLHDLLTQTFVVRGKPGLVGFDPEEFA